MTGASAASVAAVQDAGRSRRGEFAVLLLAGAVGAGLVLLASRQELARVVFVAPSPLPDSVTVVSAQDLLPSVAALAVAALASLAAVLATRGALRRTTGLIAAGLGVWIAATAAGRISGAEVLAAAGRSGASPATGTGAGAAAGSVTAGSGVAETGGTLTEFPAHVLLTGGPWRGVMIAGAAVLVVAALVMALRAPRLPVMSGRYEPPAGPAASVAHPEARARTGVGSSGGSSMWESLSAGGDPTAMPSGAGEDDARVEH